VFSFLIASSLQRDAGTISASEWDALLRGGHYTPWSRGQAAVGTPAVPSAGTCSLVTEKETGEQQRKPAWLAQQAWTALATLEAAVPAFGGITSALAADAAAAERGALQPPPAWVPVLEGDTPFEAAGSPDITAVWQQQQQQQEQQQGWEEPEREGGAAAGCLTSFQRLLLIRVLREPALPSALSAYITHQLGPGFTPGRELQGAAGRAARHGVPAQTPTATPGAALEGSGSSRISSSPDDVLSSALGDSSPQTPIVVAAERGADPLAPLLRLAAAHARVPGRGLQMVSLGQGQGPVAEGLVALSMKNGDWVVLQVRMGRVVKIVAGIVCREFTNCFAMPSSRASIVPAKPRPTSCAPFPRRPQNCHLARSWMPRLEQLVVTELPAAAAGRDPEAPLDPGFRLWLTSAPTPDFPPAVLQAAAKAALEPPRGLRAAALRALASAEDVACAGACDAAGRGAEWRRLAAASVLLHAVLRERARYGAVGWNAPYDFSDGDLACSLATLQSLLAEAPAAPAPSATTGAVGPASGLALHPTRPPYCRLPWEGLRYIIGQIHYGGRVTDELDRRLLAALVRRHMCADMLAPGATLAGVCPQARVLTEGKPCHPH
jgi:hypothetical protein